MTGGLIDAEQGDFRVGRGCVDQIFTLMQEEDDVKRIPREGRKRS